MKFARFRSRPQETPALLRWDGFSYRNHSRVSMILRGERSGAVARLAARGDRRYGRSISYRASIQSPKRKAMLRIG